MTRHFETLGDLHRERCNVWVQCRSCQHISTIMTWALNGSIGVAGSYHESMEMKRVTDVVARMVCSSCGGRDIEWTPMRTAY